MKCETCAINREIHESEEPACCSWFLEHVVIYGEDVETCPEYVENKEE